AIHILAQIRNQSTESIARFLIRALLLADQKSKFRELYKIEIEKTCLIEKLGLLRKITELRNRAKRLEKDIEAHNSQLSKYVKSFIKTHKESMRAMLGFWIREVGNFIGNKNRTIQLPLNMAQVSREEHFPILRKANKVVDETKKKTSKRRKKGNPT
ncbi:hypothetical protein PPACK8108_LOCUS25590, partial [Phakopsora pachyrhizi]